MNKINKNFWTENNKNFTDSYFYSKYLNLILYDDSSFSHYHVRLFHKL